jgi:hypothetical protein
MSMTYSDLKHEIKLGDIAYDPWGTAMAWWFAVADEIAFKRNIDTPAHWEHRPGLGCDPETYEGDMVADANDETLIKFGNLLSRYVAKLELAGRSY